MRSLPWLACQRVVVDEAGKVWQLVINLLWSAHLAVSHARYCSDPLDVTPSEMRAVQAHAGLPMILLSRRRREGENPVGSIQSAAVSNPCFNISSISPADNRAARSLPSSRLSARSRLLLCKLTIDSSIVSRTTRR